MGQDRSSIHSNNLTVDVLIDYTKKLYPKDITVALDSIAEEKQKIKVLHGIIFGKDSVNQLEETQMDSWLEKMKYVKLSKSILDVLRPKKQDEIIGQQDAVSSLISKIASPFPQHVILYGPPGVGKTTAARIALDIAKTKAFTPFAGDAKFVEVDATTLRWDPREAVNPLLGSVHDPIYQGAKKELAELGVPEPKPGLVTEAHGGILFIDEIGELDVMFQNKLLKVL